MPHIAQKSRERHANPNNNAEKAALAARALDAAPGAGPMKSRDTYNVHHMGDEPIIRKMFCKSSEGRIAMRVSGCNSIVDIEAGAVLKLVRRAARAGFGNEYRGE